MELSKALFLDRDGVINRNDKYVHKKEDCHFVDGIFDLVRIARERDYKVFVVTNQGGIGRGYYTTQEHDDLATWMWEQFANKGIKAWDAYYFCTHDPSSGCMCRKPMPGMLIKAMEEYDIDMSKSIMIGDMETDMLAAQKAGISIKILLARSNSSTANYVISELKQAEQYL